MPTALAYPFDTASWQRTRLDHGGSVYFVSSGTGTNSNANGTRQRPFATLDYAFSQCTAAAGDVIYVMPGHAETTTLVGLDVAGVRVIGLGVGRNRPTFTATTAASALIAVSAANISIENLRFVGAASGCTALMTLAAADFECNRCVFEHGAAPTEAIVINSGANRFYFDDCRFIGTADGPDSCFFFNIGSSSISEWGVSNCRFNYLPSGLDNAVFLATVDSAPGGVIRNCHAIGMDSGCLFVDFNSSVSLAEGQIVECTAQARAAATVANLYDLGGYGMVRFAINDGPQRGALLHPATSST